MNSRRQFLSTSAVSCAFLGLERFFAHEIQAGNGFSYGKLIEDPEGLLDLPSGFEYEVLSRTGDRMRDGFKVPGHPDGMAAFPLGSERVALVRNHEIGHSGFSLGPFEDNSRIPEDFDRSLCYDPGRHGAQPFVGGTTTIVYDTIRKQVIDEYLSLFGTDRNCAGGPTPWGSWITCEEPADMTTRWGVHHGYCFEVAADHRGLADPIPLRGLGRFRHEAIAVSENSGIIYLTEDRPDGAIYRFIPSMPKDLTGEGRLQALAIREKPRINTTNWPGGDTSFPIAERIPAEWVDLDDVESAKDDLRIRARQKGAALFSRAEGMWYGSAEVVGESSIYWACTDGGASHFGQIFRYFPGDSEGAEGKNGDYGEIELYLEPNDSKLLQNGDNITIAPSGHLYIAEDSSGPCCLQGVSKEGELFTFARNRLNSSELAGVCFSPDGSTLFCNIQKPGITLAITGPFV